MNSATSAGCADGMPCRTATADQRSAGVYSLPSRQDGAGGRAGAPCRMALAEQAAGDEFRGILAHWLIGVLKSFKWG